MTVDPTLYVGKCECGADIYRRTRSGAPPKWCATCRTDKFKGGPTRGNASGEPGPIRQIREAMRNLKGDVRTQAAGTALAMATGIGDFMAIAIVGTVDVLLEHGESAEQIRRRLNPNPAGFGVRRAGAPDPYSDDEDEGDDDE